MENQGKGVNGGSRAWKKGWNEGFVIVEEMGRF